MSNTSESQGILEHNRSALSLFYDGKNAPTVAAKGQEKLAELIIEKAQEQGILIHKDENLLKQLEQLEIGSEIPVTMYVVIAELIAYSYLLQGKFPDSWQ